MFVLVVHGIGKLEQAGNPHEFVCQWNGCNFKRLFGLFVFVCFHCFQASVKSNLDQDVPGNENEHYIRLLIL